MKVLEIMLAGGVGGAIIKFIESVVMWVIARKAKKFDDTVQQKADFEKKITDEIANLRADLANLKISDQVILRDRIRNLGTAYVENGEIAFNDRQDLIDMHKVYHDNLGGNGNLDALMDDIMELRLKNE